MKRLVSLRRRYSGWTNDLRGELSEDQMTVATSPSDACRDMSTDYDDALPNRIVLALNTIVNADMTDCCAIAQRTPEDRQ